MTSIICAIFIFLIEQEALKRGIDGTALTIAIICLAGIGGYKFREMVQKRKEVKK
jgi:hypothetical protein